MNARKSGQADPISPAASISILTVLLILAYLAVAVGTIAPIDFVYDGI